MSPPKPANRLLKFARKERVLLAALVGSGAGIVCTLLPEQYQVPCSFVAKVLGVVLGGG